MLLVMKSKFDINFPIQQNKNCETERLYAYQYRVLDPWLSAGSPTTAWSSLYVRQQ